MSISGAIIGGTGLGHHIGAMDGEALFVPTRFGLVKGKVVTFEEVELLCLRRHSAGHKVPPHAVNYIAIAEALRSLEIQACFASAAVGFLNPEWRVGDFVLCEDFIDLSSRRTTAFSDTVEHRDFSYPFSPELQDALIASADDAGLSLSRGGVYANLNGPRYETPQEIKSVRVLGANLVGMTAGSEAIAMGELQIPYACVSVLTNAAAGINPGVLAHEDVVSVMELRGRQLLDLLLRSAARLSR